MTGNDKDDFQQAYAAALRLLSLCDRSKNDLKERLSKKEYSPGTIEDVIRQLESMGYIDDGRFALKFALDAVKRKNVGSEAVRFGLHRKGLDQEIIEETVKKIFQENDEKSVALEALSKRLEIKSPLYKRGDGGIVFRKSDIKRLSDYLRRKGFSYDIIKEALKEIGKEDDVE